MFSSLKRLATPAMAALALILSACNTFTDIRPVPDIYQGAQTPAETALITLKAFGAAQETVDTVCATVQAEDPLADTCIVLITAEQTLRPAVKTAGLIGVEYTEIDMRIHRAGPERTPGEWVAVSSEIAARLIAAYDPIRAEIDEFIAKAGALKNG